MMMMNMNINNQTKCDECISIIIHQKLEDCCICKEELYLHKAFYSNNCLKPHFIHNSCNKNLENCPICKSSF